MFLLVSNSVVTLASATLRINEQLAEHRALFRQMIVELGIVQAVNMYSLGDYSDDHLL